MNIQELIEQGINRKRAKLEDEREASERQAWKEQDEHVKAWLPILQIIEKRIPAEIAHALTTPIHPAQFKNQGVLRYAQFVIRIPGTEIRVKCDPDGIWGREDIPRFSAMRPVAFWDEKSARYTVEWDERGEWTEDFLIALAEGAELAERLPDVEDECYAQNSAWRAADLPELPPTEPDDEPMNYIENAIASLGLVDSLSDEAQPVWIQTAQAHALIAIAQELRVFNYRSKRGG